MLPSAAAVLFIQRSFYVKKRAVIFIFLFQNLVKQFSKQKWHPHPTCYLVWLWACAAPSLSACSQTGFERAARTFLRQGDSPKDTECSCHSHVLPGFERDVQETFTHLKKAGVPVPALPPQSRVMRSRAPCLLYCLFPPSNGNEIAIISQPWYARTDRWTWKAVPWRAGRQMLSFRQSEPWQNNSVTCWGEEKWGIKWRVWRIQWQIKQMEIAFLWKGDSKEGDKWGGKKKTKNIWRSDIQTTWWKCWKHWEGKRSMTSIA